MNEILELIKKQGSLDDRRTFGFDDETLKIYIAWSATYGYLFLDSDENGISGIGVAYPVKKKFNNTNDWFYTFNDVPKRDEEKECDLCIMDLIATTPKARKNIISSFKNRFPYWDSQNKYAIVRNNPKEIKNKHINLLYNYGSK